MEIGDKKMKIQIAETKDEGIVNLKCRECGNICRQEKSFLLCNEEIEREEEIER